MTIYRRLGVHTYAHIYTCTCTHTHTWCMNTNDAMTVWFSQIGDHTLGNQHPTGQGQNRALSVKKKKKSNRLSAPGRVYSCRDTFTPNVYGNACEVDCEGLEATKSRLVPAVPHRSGSESNSIRRQLRSCHDPKPTIFCICFSWQIHDDDVYQCIRG